MGLINKIGNVKILILGAAGRIEKGLTIEVLAKTPYKVVLYAKNANVRLKVRKSERVKMVDGDLTIWML